MKKTEEYICALPTLWARPPLRLVQLPSGLYVIHFRRVEGMAAAARTTRMGIPLNTTIVTPDGQRYVIPNWLYPCIDDDYDLACEHTQEQVLALLAPLGLTPTFTRDITRFED